MLARPRTRLRPVIVALALVAAACQSEAGTTSSAAGTASGTAPATNAEPTNADPGALAEVLDFEAPLLGGGVLRGADYAGKDVAFWFWAPW